MTTRPSLADLAKADEARQTEVVIGNLTRKGGLRPSWDQPVRPVQTLPELITVAKRSPLPWLALLVAGILLLGKSRGGTLDWE